MTNEYKIEVLELALRFYKKYRYNGICFNVRKAIRAINLDVVESLLNDEIVSTTDADIANMKFIVTSPEFIAIARKHGAVITDDIHPCCSYWWDIEKDYYPCRVATLEEVIKYYKNLKDE